MDGLCKLTRKRGRFVKSHIIPRALSDLALDKPGRIEFGEGFARPKLRYTSWFDSTLVVDEGEKKLASYDDIAVAELRRIGLTWRYFPINEKLAKREKIDDTGWEFITAPSERTKALRLFFHSVLWRAAFSRRPEFKNIRLDMLSREKLRKIVNGEIEPHDSDFPVVLILMTTKGQPQVNSPTRDMLSVPVIEPDIKPYQNIFRFFFDGLIAHIGRKKTDTHLLKSWGSRCVGVNNELFILGRPYEGSKQASAIEFFQDELDRRWPVEAKRIYGAI